jgi:hypothetical protein
MGWKYKIPKFYRIRLTIISRVLRRVTGIVTKNWPIAAGLPRQTIMKDCMSDDLTPRKNIFGKALVGIAPQLEVKLVRIVMKEGGASWDEDAWLVSNILACTLLLQT